MGFRGFNPETLAELDAIQKQIDALNRQSDSDWSGFTGEVLNVPNATYWDNGRAPTLDGGTAERTPVHPTAGGSSILPRSSTNAEMVKDGGQVMGLRGFNPETLAELRAIQNQINTING